MRQLLSAQELKEIDAFFGPERKFRPALFKHSSSLIAQSLAQKARGLMDELCRENLLPASPQEPYIDWWFTYLALVDRGKLSRDDFHLIRYFYPDGPRYGSPKSCQSF